MPKGDNVTFFYRFCLYGGFPKGDKGREKKRERGVRVEEERKREQLEEAATVKVRHREIPPYPISGSCPPPIPSLRPKIYFALTPRELKVCLLPK